MLALPGSDLVTHLNSYRVDGEVGCFQFETYDVRDNRGRIVVRALDWLPRRTGKQWYQTIGFKEQALIHGALDRSYRKTDVALNLQRRQVQGGTPLRTLRDIAVTQGEAILAAIEQEAELVLPEFLDLFQATIERYHEAKAQKEAWATEETASWRSAWTSLDTGHAFSVGETS